tara:strand:- start:1956 stop:2381 length:426 start_codon:yes stop_codon:yes gene_type:complete
MKKKAVIVSGYFNPIHKGHIEYINLSKKLGDYLIVIVNNDFQRKLKGSNEFMNEDERQIILNNIKAVDKVYLSIDKDKTVIETLKLINDDLGDKYNLFFSNGGDQNNNSIAEKEICKNLKIELVDNMGKKIQSSSWLLNKN